MFIVVKDSKFGSGTAQVFGRFFTTQKKGKWERGSRGCGGLALILVLRGILFLRYAASAAFIRDHPLNQRDPCSHLRTKTFESIKIFRTLMVVQFEKLSG